MIATVSYRGIDRVILTNFLTARDWEQSFSKDFSVVRYSKQIAGGVGERTRQNDQLSEARVNIFLPNSDQIFASSDIEVAIRVLSNFYSSSEDEMVSSVKRVAVEVVLAKLPVPSPEGDTISVGAAGAFIACMRDLIASSATTEIVRKQTFFRNTKEAREFSQECRFGHTFKGSFGFKIETPPAGQSLDVDSLFPTVTFGSRVVERMQRCLRLANKAIKAESAEPLVGVSSGVSANMCNTLASLAKEVDVDSIDFVFQRCISRDFPMGRTQALKFGTGAKVSDFLKRAAELIDRKQPPIKQTLIGKILQLRSDGGPLIVDDETVERIILLQTTYEDNAIKVSVPLDAKMYLRAVDAHKEGALFEVTGMLTRIGSRWSLSDVL